VKIYVVDACVAIKWFVPEIHKEAARRLRNPSYQLHVPNLFLMEFGNIVCKKLRRKEISLEVGKLIVNQIQNVLLEWHQDDGLFPKAFEMANKTDGCIGFHAINYNQSISF
jgi:predicted nucleic acid-binding protein